MAPICSPATTAINTHLHAATAFTYPRDRRYTVTEPFFFFFLLLFHRCIALVFSLKALPQTKRSSGDPEVFTPRFWAESKEMHHHGFALGVEETAKDEKTRRGKHHPREGSKGTRPASRENKAALTLWFVADF